MKLPLQITFHNMSHDEEVEASITAHAEWLEHYTDRIMSCRVIVDRPHRHPKEGNTYQVRIDLKLPGDEVAMTRESSQASDYESLYVVIREAFHELRRQVEDRVRIERGEVKVHDPLPRARIATIF